MASSVSVMLALVALSLQYDVIHSLPLKNGTTRITAKAFREGLIQRLAKQWKMGAPIKLSEARKQNLTIEEYNKLVREVVENSNGSHVIDIGRFKPVEKLSADRHYFVGRNGEINKMPHFRHQKQKIHEKPHENLLRKPMTSHRRKRASEKRKYRAHVSWPDSRVPYRTNNMIPGDEFIPWIQQGVDMFHKETCLNWVDRSNEVEYVDFMGGDQEGFCAAFIGRLHNRVTPVYLDQVTNFCRADYVVVHEMMHAIGIDHEQARPDRYTNLKMNWECIVESTINNYIKAPLATDVEFDWTSIMQYIPTIFNKCAQRGTMETTDLSYNFLLYVLESEFTHYDSQTIVDAYGCDDDCTDNCENGGFIRKTVNNDQCHCRCPDYLTGPTCASRTSTCGEIIELQEGETKEFSTSGYPGPYPVDEACTYLIKAPANNRIIITLKELDVPCGHDMEFRVNLMGQYGLLECGSLSSEKEFVTTPNSEANTAMVVLHGNGDPTITPGTGGLLEATAFASGCIDNPCRNGGTCDEDIATPAFCICPPGYSGDTCNFVSASASVGCDIQSDVEGICCFTDVSDNALEFFQIRQQEDVMFPYLLASTVGNSLTATDEALLESNVEFEDAVRCLSFEEAVIRDPGSNAKVKTTYTEMDGTVVLVSETEDTGGFFVSRQVTLSRHMATISFSATTALGGAAVANILISPGPCSDATCGTLSFTFCENGGICVGSIEPLSCNCVNGFTGTYCELPPDPCNGVDCGVNGDCVVTSVEAGTTMCNCMNDFTGPICDTPPADPCNGVDCGVNGDCVVTDVQAGTTMCNCMNDFTGPDCDTPPDPCLLCGPDEICVVDNTGLATCHDPCAEVDCGANGHCVVDGPGSTTCICVNGFTGDNCENDPCFDCGPGGICVVDDAGLATCHDPCFDCGPGGICVVDDAGLATCHDPCLLCGPDEICVVDDTGLATCHDPCAEVDCGANGNCVVDGPGSTTCICVNSFTGDNCENDPCTEVDCGANGNCVVDGTGSTTCVCTNGFTGETCENDPCTEVDCGANGNCVFDGTGSTTCMCTNGFTGETCENDPCTEVDCGANGNCVFDGTGSTTCMCTNGFTGETCENDPCTEVDCGANGNCVFDGTGSTTCMCTNGFTGETCENDLCSVLEQCQAGGNCDVTTNKTYVPTTVKCTFEKGTKCAFSNPSSATDTWRVGRKSTQERGTGPFAAFEGERYLHTDAKTRTETTSTYSWKVDLSEMKRCLVLNYMMNGRHVKSLTVYNGDLVVFEKLGNKRNIWKTKTIEVTTTPGTELAIVGVSTNKKGDIAIDDLQLLPFSCDKILICTFEKNNSPCTTSGSTRWRRKKQQPGGSLTGQPKRANDGYYFLYPRFSGNRNVKAILQINHSFSGAACLTFNYHMSGPNTGGLSVVLPGNNPGTIWTLSGDQSKGWKEIAVNIPVIDNQIVRIEATKGTGSGRDTAIDSVVLKNFACP